MDIPSLPTGYRFCPEPEASLVYLKRKILNQKLPADIIPTVDVYSCADPRQIPFGEFKHGVEDEWHFFTTKRKDKPIQTANGCWEEIADEEIFDNNQSVGFMKVLVFKFLNSEDMREERDWYIHEFRANPASFTPDELADDNVKEKISNFILCKVFLEEEDSSMPPTPSSSSGDMVDDEQDEEVQNGKIDDLDITYIGSFYEDI